MIDDPQRARRLARAICSDVLLYHGDEARSGTRGTFDAVLAGPLAEARALYVARVAPDLTGLFESVSAEMLEAVRVQLPDGPPAVFAHPPVPSVAPPHEGAWGEPPRRAERDRGTAGLVVVALAIVVAAAVVAAALLFRH